MKKINNGRLFWFALSSTAALTSLFSLCIGLQQSVWFDEAYSILLAEHSWGEIVRLTAQDVHPPVYYWLLKAWMMLFGSSELALRSVSAVFLGLSIFTAGLLLRKFFGVKTTLVALPFLILAPFLLRYGFEIRMYSLASFLGVSATYILVLAVEETQKRKRWLLFLVYALLVALGVYTLYFIALLWIAHFVWLAWLVFTEKRLEILKLGLVAYVLALVSFIPWLPIFLGKAGGDSLSPVTSHLDLANLHGIVTYFLLYRPPWDVMGIGFGLVLLALVMIGYISWWGVRNAAKKERRYLMLLAMYFLVPIAVLIVVTYFKPIYIERYLAHVALGFYALLGILVALSLRNATNLTLTAIGGLVTVLIIGCVSLAEFGNYNFQRLHKPAIKEVATLLSDCKDGAVIFADGPQVAMELMYYETECPVYFFNETLEMGGGFAMLSGSPLRVIDASKLPETSKILHVYYDKPKRSMPESFSRNNTTSIEAISVTTYGSARDD